MNTKFHTFGRPVGPEEWPERFTFPFHYRPHALSVEAATLLQAYIRSQSQWSEELSKGKMFGVLVAVSPEGETGFFAAFSGLLDGESQHEYFVPPVYDLTQPDGFFRQEESLITGLNVQIARLECDKAYRDSLAKLEQETALSVQALEEAARTNKASKAKRAELRKQCIDEATLASLVSQSQKETAAYRRFKQAWKKRLSLCQVEVDAFRERIDRLKQERRSRSAQLQQKLFGQYVICNARGESTDLTTLFQRETGMIPPSGAGDCAAPKLLQYAYLNGFRPLAMAEFWWGESPKEEVRHHGFYYPACRGKCGPILGFMLQGLEVEDNPLLSSRDETLEFPVLYEDQWIIVIDKPAGLLSVPGKTEADSVYRLICDHYPKITGPVVVHRLDMATSGVMILAKSRVVYQKLQVQFLERSIQKRYVALLDGIFTGEKEGTINLALRPDYMERPCQVVDNERGKPAVTRYRIEGFENGYTRVTFIPETGRTHQLRVHASHTLGLNIPIRGDELYGRPSDRLYLHAESITFVHPVSGESVTIEQKAPF